MKRCSDWNQAVAAPAPRCKRSRPNCRPPSECTAKNSPARFQELLPANRVTGEIEIASVPVCIPPFLDRCAGCIGCVFQIRNFALACYEDSVSTIPLRKAVPTKVQLAQSLVISASSRRFAPWNAQRHVAHPQGQHWL